MTFAHEGRTGLRLSGLMIAIILLAIAAVVVVAVYAWSPWVTIMAPAKAVATINRAPG